MQSLASQVFAFGITVLTGITIGLLFDFYRVTKETVSPPRVFNYLGDLLFWVITTLVVFFLLLVGNWGEIRLYVVIGVLTGILVYSKLLSGLVIKTIRFIFFLLKKTISSLLKIGRFSWLVLTYPIVLAKKIIIIPVGYLGLAWTRAGHLTGYLFRYLITGPATRRALLMKSKLGQIWGSWFKKE